MLKSHILRIARFMWSNRKHSVSKVATAILTSAAFTVASLGVVPAESLDKKRGNPPDVESLKKRGASGLGTGATMTPILVAPLFLQDEQFTSALSLVNASSESTYATVTLRSLSGQTILQKKVPLAGTSPGQVAVQQLLQEANSRETRGSIVVEQSPDLKGMAVLAQLSITYQGAHTSYVDEELAMPNPAMGSSTLRAVGRSKGESVLVAISSLSQSGQQIGIDCVSRNVETISNTVELPPNATVLVQACKRHDSTSTAVSANRDVNPGEFDDEKGVEPSGTEELGFSLCQMQAPVNSRHLESAVAARPETLSSEQYPLATLSSRLPQVRCLPECQPDLQICSQQACTNHT